MSVMDYLHTWTQHCSTFTLEVSHKSPTVREQITEVLIISQWMKYTDMITATNANDVFPKSPFIVLPLNLQP